MAIPGLKPSFDVRSKVRVGVKKTSAGGKEYPASVDYFVCDDPLFVSVAGVKPKELRIMLPHAAAEDNFSTGLEQWAGAMLVCYTKNDQIDGKTAAFRKKTLKRGNQEVNLLAGFEVIGEQMGNERMPVRCDARECPIFKQKDGCKPMGRLQFYLAGSDPSAGLFQLDTKSWNSIEQIEGFLSLLGDPRGKELILRVEMWSRGTSKFPVVTLEGVEVQANNESQVAVMDAAVQLHKQLAVEPRDEDALKRAFAGLLDLTNPGWREKEAFVARIREVGVETASKSMLERLDA